MRIGILTFHNEDNYGALLQAYSLQQTLLKLGAESEFIELEPKHPDQASKGESTSGGKLDFFAKKLQLENKKRSYLFQAFRDAHLKCSKVFTEVELELLSASYDRFIVGSDQVWNFYSPIVDYRYILPFVPKEKRFSYAASFGTTRTPETNKALLADAFQQFQMISVREESGKEIIYHLTGREAVLCVDPSLLMRAEDFASIEKGQTITVPYVLLFILNYDSELVERAKQYATENSLQLKTITACFMPQFGFESWVGTGEEEWIYLVHYAEAVFTNSFHGTALSLIFGRTFMVATLKGALEGRNGRLLELIKLVEAQQCLSEPITIPIAFFEEKIKHRKQISMDYLQKVAVYNE